MQFAGRQSISEIMAKRKKDSGLDPNTVLILVFLSALILLLAWGFTHNWFNFNIMVGAMGGGTIVINQTIIEKLNLPPSPSCTITFDKSQVCTGDFVQGTARGYGNDACDLYYRVNGGNWFRDPITPTYHLSSSGTYTERRQAVNAGVFEFKGLCSQCVAGVGRLTVVDCPEEKDCYAKCEDAGYLGGYDGNCDMAYLYEGETQVGDCCCFRDVLPEGHRCWDTDTDPVIGSNNPEKFGTCYDEAHPTGIADYCGLTMGDNWVGENFCSYGTCMGVSELCPLTTEHCVNGECVPYS